MFRRCLSFKIMLLFSCIYASAEDGGLNARRITPLAEQNSFVRFVSSELNRNRFSFLNSSDGYQFIALNENGMYELPLLKNDAVAIILIGGGGGGLPTQREHSFVRTGSSGGSGELKIHTIYNLNDVISGGKNHTIEILLGEGGAGGQPQACGESLTAMGGSPTIVETSLGEIIEAEGGARANYVSSGGTCYGACNREPGKRQGFKNTIPNLGGVLDDKNSVDGFDGLDNYQIDIGDTVVERIPGGAWKLFPWIGSGGSGGGFNSKVGSVTLPSYQGYGPSITSEDCKINIETFGGSGNAGSVLIIYKIDSIESDEEFRIWSKSLLIEISQPNFYIARIDSRDYQSKYSALYDSYCDTSEGIDPIIDLGCKNNISGVSFFDRIQFANDSIVNNDEKFISAASFMSKADNEYYESNALGVGIRLANIIRSNDKLRQLMYMTIPFLMSGPSNQPPNIIYDGISNEDLFGILGDYGSAYYQWEEAIRRNAWWGDSNMLNTLNEFRKKIKSIKKEILRRRKAYERYQRELRGVSSNTGSFDGNEVGGFPNRSFGIGDFAPSSLGDLPTCSGGTSCSAGKGCIYSFYAC